MDFATFEKGEELSSAPEWVSGLPNMGDLKLRVYPISAPHIARLHSRLNRQVPLSERTPDGDLIDEAEVRIEQELMFAVLDDWDNFTEDGEKADCTDEKKRKYLANEMFRGLVRACSLRQSTKVQLEHQRMLKNSAPSSSGGKKTAETSHAPSESSSDEE